MTFAIGLLGSLILVTGSAWPDRAFKKPHQSVKNWLLAVGAIFMLVYSVLNYQAGGPVFFVFLQLLANIAGIMMLGGVSERISTPAIVGLGILLVIWSLNLSQDISTLFFIIGLSGIALGYVMPGGTLRRNIALMLGSLLIAIFSYLGASWIFFWLNAFFALFSGYYAWKVRK